jgi:hypothetical protein
MCILAAPDSEHYLHQADVAELQFTDVKEVPYFSLSSAESLEGESVLVIGNPEGYTGTVSTDIISAVRNRQTVVQITAPISPWARVAPPFLMSVKTNRYREADDEGKRRPVGAAASLFEYTSSS